MTPGTLVVRPYEGPSSFDFCERSGRVYFAFGVFERSIPAQTRAKICASVIVRMAGGAHAPLVQFQSKLWERRGDERRLDRESDSVVQGRGWIAVLPSNDEHFVRAMEAFWPDKEIRVYGRLPGFQYSSSRLATWYRKYLDDYTDVDLAEVRLVADYVWSKDQVVLVTSQLNAIELSGIVAREFERSGLPAIHQREPFLSTLGEIVARGVPCQGK